jgi:hypothetical protein
VCNCRHCACGERWLGRQRLRGLYQKVRRPYGCPIPENLLKELHITHEVDVEDLAGIPKTGPAIVIANHPFGMLETAVLGTMLPRIRRDVKNMTNYVLAGLPETSELAGKDRSFSSRMPLHPS